jgi:hypothetical protein
VIYDSRTLMRTSRGLPLALRVALHAILAGLIFGITPPVTYAQAASTLPKSWNDAAAKLADEVAAAMSPTSVTLDVENISSLDVSSAASIEASVRAQLQRHSFSLAPETSAAAQTAVRLQLSLSESAAEYVWVMQILNDPRDGSAVPVMIVAAPKGDFADAGAEAQSLSLQKRFVWKQPERFLDFALLKEETSGRFTLLVLAANRLATYRQDGSGWQLSGASPIPQAVPPSRDPQGTIHLKEGKLSLNGFACVGQPDLAGALQCETSIPASILPGPLVDIPGYPVSLGALVSEKCRGELISLYTAESDWTQSDSIRGYLSEGIPLPFVASGNPVEFDGPVMSLKAEPDAGAARAVVHNLKTGAYEAYIVTATCGN